MRDKELKTNKLIAPFQPQTSQNEHTNFQPKRAGRGSQVKTRHPTPKTPQGVSCPRQDIPPSLRKRGNRTHLQIKRVCQILQDNLGKLDSKEKSETLVALILDKEQPPENSDLYKEVEKLKELLTIFKSSSLKGLEQLAQGKTAKVLVDTKKKVAYKLITVTNGNVGGTFPNEIRIRPEDNQILISGCQNHSLLKMLSAIHIANNHRAPLYTNLAGFTEDGDVILCQPYIENLEPLDMLSHKSLSNDSEIQNSIKCLGMTPLGDIGSPFAVATINGRYAIFDDLHGENIMKNNKGEIFLVDSLATRYLNQKEIKMLKDYLPKIEDKDKNQISIFT